MKYDDSVLLSEGIEYSASVGFDKCEIINERRLGALKKQLEPESLIVFLVPYFAGEEKRNISKYAISKDYHLYMRGLFERVCPQLEMQYGGRFYGMADSSPVNEVRAAVYAGLGVLGDNGMIINEKYGSYVFIGAVYTDVKFEYGADKTGYCYHCGTCKKACPMSAGRECLSAVTQKKGSLTDEEIKYVKEYGSAWGCDICSDVCPLCKDANKTPVKFFYEDRTPYLTLQDVENMTDAEFSERAYSWRGKEVIKRNLKLFD